jgi:hypothetical protein
LQRAYFPHMTLTNCMLATPCVELPALASNPASPDAQGIQT